MADRLDWATDGSDWPNREASRFVEAGGVRWHVQEAGQGPCVLLVHGTGASTHSWRDLLPLLTPTFRVVAMDLPGHGFTDTPPGDGLSLTGMAGSLAALLRTCGVSPDLVVGHSAGAAILIRACLDATMAPRRIVSLNGAVLPLHGLAGTLFSPAARLLATFSPVPRLFARRAASDPAVVERLIRSTGSRLDPRGIALYRRIVSSPGHAAAALGMMARWDLDSLERDLPRLDTPLTLVVGMRDRTIRPADAYRLRRILPAAEIVRLPDLGHLAHEEAPAEHAALLRRLADATGAPSA